MYRGALPAARGTRCPRRTNHHRAHADDGWIRCDVARSLPYRGCACERMKRVQLPGTEIVMSRLSFGTSRLHHVPSGKHRQSLLAAAFDAGFTHFDTAPLYGFGLAESDLGGFLKARRGRV